MSESAKNRRAQAAAARDAANSDERRRERMVRIIGAITVVVVVVAIVAVAIIAKSSNSNDVVADTTVDTTAKIPTGVYAADAALPFGVPYGSTTSGVPVLAIWEDFQCPACGAVEKANGAGIEKLADDGKVTLVWRPTTFLDINLGPDNKKNGVANSSQRAAAAWGCAIDAGKTKEYHNAVYANQPETEGTGYTDDQLISFAEQAGISGADLETFKSCVSEGTYLAWANNGYATFVADNVGGTPYATLDGVEVPTAILADAAQLEAYVASGGASAESAAASASPAAS